MKSLLPTIALSVGVIVWAGQIRADAMISGNQPVKHSARSSWAIAFDNDMLVPGPRDQDYTYGINITLAGKHAENRWASLHRPLDWINQRIGFNDRFDHGISASKMEYGLIGFTPEDISRAEALQEDRPYASLVYVSSSREEYDSVNEVSWQSTLTLGVMGLSIVGEIQQAVHSSFNSSQPRGWKNQISAGGEPTARYHISRQRLLHNSGEGLEIKSTIQASMGYITEASWSLGLRAGKILTPWVSFNPELTSYGEKSTPNATGKVTEQYFWVGISFKARIYNAFLQGQFKDSEVTYHSDEINHAIVEAWMGYTFGFVDGYSLSYSLRGHTSELRHGSGNRGVLWGGVLLSKTFD